MDIKAYAQWEEHGGSFSDFAKPGDLVDERIADHFLNCVPPASFERGYIQGGEPYSHEKDETTGRYRPTFATFKREGDAWLYCGNCFVNETTNRR